MINRIHIHCVELQNYMIFNHVHEVVLNAFAKHKINDCITIEKGSD